MVFGALLDQAVATKLGTSSVAVLTRGNLGVQGLSLRVRLLFWLTNLPYWLLALRLLLAPADLLGAGQFGHQLHVAAATVVALASTAFHGAVLFGDARAQLVLVPKLLTLDLLAANSYGAALAVLRGVSLVLPAFSAPLVCLAASAIFKRIGRPNAYAAGHGTWHVLSALAIEHCIFAPGPAPH